MIIYYSIILGLTLLLTFIYVFMWHKHSSIHFTLIYIFIAISNLGFFLFSLSTTLEEAVLAYKFTYIGGCYVTLFMMFLILYLCHVKFNSWIILLSIALSTFMFTSALTIGYIPFFYNSVGFELVDGNPTLIKDYGIMHTLFYVMVIVYILVGLGAIAYGFSKKKEISRKILVLLATIEIVVALSFFLSRLFSISVELLPLGFVIFEFIGLIILNRINLYDVTDCGIDTIEKTKETGFISFDKKYHYLGSNDVAKEIFPILSELTIDKPIENIMPNAYSWLMHYLDGHNDFYYSENGKIYLIKVNDLYIGRFRSGYQFMITDDTKNQKYIELLDKYNTELKDEVDLKTKHIIEMHDRLVMSMAQMVESRDNSTGGHIRRTSEGVRFLIEEIKKDNYLNLSDEFCKNIIKAAPMHDLGKIAVDDAILRKPGKFTPEEFEIMKTHASEGQKIVHQILEGTDDKYFQQIAENVAHYHHERIDGSGYPDKLKGEEIPLEARIMAIADVYDALVSKRVYKEKMSFEEANKIIMDGMGTQFDKNLEKYYVNARPKLEKYYSEIDN